MDDRRLDSLLRRTSLRQIEIIFALHEHRSMTRAAAALGMTVANVSRAAKRFEKNLGMRLFEGEGRRYVLSDVSSEVFNHLGPIVLHIQEFRKALEGADLKGARNSLKHRGDNHMPRLDDLPSAQRSCKEDPAG